jgi:hypothetical protein
MSVNEDSGMTTHSADEDYPDIENQIKECSEKSIGSNADEWTSDIEILISKWKEQIEKLSHIHQESAYITKTRYYRLAIPSIIIPFVMTLVSQNLYTDNANPGHIVDGVAFMLTSVLSGLTVFLRYGQTYEEHFQTSTRYVDIVNRIDSELARKRKFRTPSDVFITEMKCKIDFLNEDAPDLPGNWC